MQISAITNNAVHRPINKASVTQLKQPNTGFSDTYTKKSEQSFTSAYQNIFEHAVKKELRNIDDVEKIYTMLLKGALKDTDITRNFNAMIELMQKVPKLEHLLLQLCNPTYLSTEGRMMKFAIDEPLVIFRKKGEPLIQLENHGTFGIWNKLFNRSAYPIDARIVFNLPGNKLYGIEFGLDKKLNMYIERPYDYHEFWSNGNLRKVTDYKGTRVTKKFYNPDGSQNYLKTFFRSL